MTVSLDALDDAIFRRMNDVDFPVADVLDGIDAALRAGLAPIKVNMVVKRGTNDHEIVPMARHFRERYGPAVILRFIEYMDVGATNGWRMDDVLPSAEVRARAWTQVFPLEPLQPNDPGEIAERWRYADGGGEIGVISQRHAGLLPRLHPRPAVHRRQALPVPVRQPRPRPARPAARRLQRRADRRGHRADLGRARRPLFRTARRRRICRHRQGERRVEMHYIGG